MWATVQMILAHLDQADPPLTLGEAFDRWARDKFPTLQAAPEGRLTPIWMHTTATSVEDVWGSMRNTKQMDLALQLVSDFIRDTGRDAKDIVFLSPHKANVDYGNRQLAKGHIAGWEAQQPSKFHLPGGNEARQDPRRLSGQ